MLGHPERVVTDAVGKLGLRDDLAVKLRHAAGTGGVMILH